jgi:hypothetical protein
MFKAAKLGRGEHFEALSFFIALNFEKKKKRLNCPFSFFLM